MGANAAGQGLWVRRRTVSKGWEGMGSPLFTGSLLVTREPASHLRPATVRRQELPQ